MLFMAIDQYGHAYHGLKYPRKDLCKILGRKHVDKMYIDKKDGPSAWIGYVIKKLWLTLYRVEPFEKPL
jgi:hypothetical protein